MGESRQELIAWLNDVISMSSDDTNTVALTIKFNKGGTVWSRGRDLPNLRQYIS